MGLRYLFAFVLLSFASLMIWEVAQDEVVPLVAMTNVSDPTESPASVRSPASVDSVNLCLKIKKELYSNQIEFIFYDIKLNVRNPKLSKLTPIRQLQTCFEYQEHAPYKIEIEAFSSNWLGDEELSDVQLQISLFDTRSDKVAEFGMAYLINSKLDLLPYLPQE